MELHNDVTQNVASINVEAGQGQGQEQEVWLRQREIQRQEAWKGQRQGRQQQEQKPQGWNKTVWLGQKEGDDETDLFLECGHKEFPFCRCLEQWAIGKGPQHPGGGRDITTTTTTTSLPHARSAARGARQRQRGYIASSLNAFRDAGLEVFDETEESDFHDSETEPDATPTVTTPELEGAVGGEEQSGTSGGLLAPPGLAGGRRASIVSCDSRRESIDVPSDPVKVAVFGADGVGKSALIVRLLTGRFIGEYDPTLEAVYSYQVPLPGHTLPLQVMDTAGQVDVSGEGRERQVSWGEGFMLVFSLTSHASFAALSHLRRVILELTPGPPRPLVLVGNKADLTHARQVNDDEIRDLADTWGCEYYEVAAPEPWEVVVRPFVAIYQAILEARASH